MLVLPPRLPSPLSYLAVLATIVIRWPIVVSQQRPGCCPGTYLDASTGSCLACIDGVNFVSEEYNRQPRCLDCSVCRGIMIAAVNCSATRDTVCRCPNGFTTTVEGHCRPVKPGAEDSPSLTDSRTSFAAVLSTGAEDSPSLTDSRTTSASVLSTGPFSDGRQSAEAKPLGVETTLLHSIDAKLDELTSYVKSILGVIVPSIIVFAGFAIWTFCHKKAREPGSQQPVDNQGQATAATKAPESATTTHVDEDKDKSQGEKQVLLSTLRTDHVALNAVSSG